MKSSSNTEAEWVPRGLLTASDCYNCVNKLESSVEGYRVHILCRDPCNYKHK